MCNIVFVQNWSHKKYSCYTYVGGREPETLWGDSETKSIFVFILFFSFTWRASKDHDDNNNNTSTTTCTAFFHMC